MQARYYKVPYDYPLFLQEILLCQEKGKGYFPSTHSRVYIHRKLSAVIFRVKLKNYIYSQSSKQTLNICKYIEVKLEPLICNYLTIYKQQWGNTEQNLIKSSIHNLFCISAKEISKFVSFHRLLVSMKLPKYVLLFKRKKYSLEQIYYLNQTNDYP